MTATLYGIPNCETVRKARAWLEAQGQAVPFHDFRRDGLERRQLEEWARAVGWDTLLNRKGMTWRQAPEAAKAAVTGQAAAVAFMLERPSAIKRPVLVKDGAVHVGFSEAAYRDLFGPRR